MEKGLSGLGLGLGLDLDLDLDLGLYRDSNTKSNLNGLEGLEENLEKREKEKEKDEDRDIDTDTDQDKDKDQKDWDLDGELNKELGERRDSGSGKEKREGRLGEIGIGIEKDRSTEKEAHHRHGMPNGWTAMKDLRGKPKQKQKQKYKAGERANGNPHAHTDMTSTGISKSQTDGDEGGVVGEEIEDLGDLDLAELNSGDDLLPDEDDEEEGSVRGRAIGTHGADGAADGAADDGFGRVSSERDPVGFNEAHFKVYKRRWFGLVQLVLLNIIVSWDWLTFSASSTTVSQYYHVSESAINWLSTAFLFAFVLASPLVIYVLHHGGPKPAILIASVLLLLGNWIRYGATRSGTHGNFGGVMFGQILTGIAQPFVLAAPTRYSDLWFTNQGRVAATAVMSLANPFGGALAQLIDPFWAGSVGSIPNMVLYIAIISSIATIPSFFIPKGPPTPCSASSEEPKHALGPSLRFLLRSPEFYMMMFPFWFYVGLFNSISSLINQMLSPYSFSETNAGIAGALLIVVGLVAAAITSPLIDRTKTYLLAIKIQIPILGICYLAFTWAPQTRSLAAIFLLSIPSCQFSAPQALVWSLLLLSI
ncbi:hypothetical protein DID88_004793 [Monilinia fructigena]|uniref:Major facilitator superfamily (MFS) profile domain-containing protein n=1 Tax=Monilinia fructigena TaxID=38457 RepID=A0A395IPL7_9HELO|nr:hypothetical protein DID88_004793 [Monilinia fructigena]